MFYSIFFNAGGSNNLTTFMLLKFYTILISTILFVIKCVYHFHSYGADLITVKNCFIKKKNQDLFMGIWLVDLLGWTKKNLFIMGSNLSQTR